MLQLTTPTQQLKCLAMLHMNRTQTHMLTHSALAVTEGTCHLHLPQDSRQLPSHLHTPTDRKTEAVESTQHLAIFLDDLGMRLADTMHLLHYTYHIIDYIVAW